MKIIISHDVDHVSTREHWFRDLFIWKFLFKTVYYLVTHRIGWSVGWRRVLLIFGGQLHHVPEIMALDRANGIRSTFFVGVANGLGMSYSIKTAESIARLIRSNGFAVGVHGIAYDEEQNIKKEFEKATALLYRIDGGETGQKKSERRVANQIGIRNHYLRFKPETPLLQQRAGYVFDSSEYDLKAPYFVNGLIEFPVCLMDSHLLTNCGDGDVSVQRETIRRLEDAEELGLSHFTVIFHDFYYSACFPESKAWYDWFIAYVHGRYETTDFISACVDIVQRGSDGLAPANMS